MCVLVCCCGFSDAAAAAAVAAACRGSPHLEACLSSLNSRDISRNTTADDDQVLLLYPTVSACSRHFHLSLQAPAYQLPRRILVAATCSGSRCWMRRMCCSRRGGSPSAGRAGPETGTLCKERAKQKPKDSCGGSAAMTDVNGWVVGLEVVVELGRSAASTFPKSELGRGGQRRCGASHWSASSLANHHEDCTEGKTDPHGTC